MKIWTDSDLYYNLEFLFYECGRIGRGHAAQAKQAKDEALKEMKLRGFDSYGDLSKRVKKLEKEGLV